MIELKAYPKINLGLRVLRRRDDGFHDIETVMVPLGGLHDTISVEALPTESTFVTLTPTPYPAPTPVFPTESVLELSGPLSGSLEVDCPPEQNICMRALRLMQYEYGIGEAVIRLDKTIPTGAGLGGGSADAAAVLCALSREFVLELPDDQLEWLAEQLGSDVPFFIRGGAQLCTGRGEVMSAAEIDLTGKWLVVVKPDVAVSTAEAYAGIALSFSYKGGVSEEPGGKLSSPSLPDILRRPVAEWRGLLANDFEESVFARHPEIAAIKDALYDAGALYASMSGSGSAVFGIFDRRPEGVKQRFDPGIFLHVEQLKV